MTVSLALVGLVLMPALMLSAAWLSQRLSRERAHTGLRQQTARWLNHLTLDLSQTVVLSPESNARRLCYAFYDALTLRTQARCHALIALNASGGLLSPWYLIRQERLSSGRWRELAALGNHQAAERTLSHPAFFDYADPEGHRVAPTQATQVVLRGWTLTQRIGKAHESLTLPQTAIPLAPHTQPELSWPLLSVAAAVRGSLASDGLAAPSPPPALTRDGPVDAWAYDEGGDAWYALDTHHKLLRRKSHQTPGRLPVIVSLDAMGQPLALAIAQRTGTVLVLDGGAGDDPNAHLWAIPQNGPRWRVCDIPWRMLAFSRRAPRRDSYSLAYDDTRNLLTITAHGRARQTLVSLPDRL